MILAQFSLNMALRFENDSKTLHGRLNALICTYVFKSLVDACMFQPHFGYVFACLFCSAGLSVSVLDWSSNEMPAVWLHLKCFVLCLFTCFNYSQRPAIKTDSTIEQMNSFTCL